MPGTEPRISCRPWTRSTSARGALGGYSHFLALANSYGMRQRSDTAGIRSPAQETYLGMFEHVHDEDGEGQTEDISHKTSVEVGVCVLLEAALENETIGSG